jgi:hypothetical protein
MIGVSTVATNPRFRSAALNTGGGTLVDIYTSPGNRERLRAVFAGLGINLDEVFPPAGGTANPATVARYAQTLSVAKWVLDPAEPLNYATALEAKDYDAALQPLVDAGVAFAATDAYGQLVEGEERVPNANSRLLYELAGIPYTTYRTPGVTDVFVRHSLLLYNFAATPEVAAGERIRDDYATFLASLVPPLDAIVEIP